MHAYQRSSNPVRVRLVRLILHIVWFEDVCEDAITIKQSSGTSTIRGGGALHAEDKVVQHNGGGTVVIDSFCVWASIQPFDDIKQRFPPSLGRGLW